ncbi:uncharacterized protein [Amphiura filiformis]|uniref:uncharacterized protein n=1 Tax=Amphiura filiformis TaxID=82378 RepID=UPI003B21BF77
MATAAPQTSPDNFVKVLQAVQHITWKTLPSVDNCITIWHNNQIHRTGLKRCSQPNVCPCMEKPKHISKLKALVSKEKYACHNCKTWTKALQNALYTPEGNQRTDIEWDNVNLTRIYDDHMEVGNAFVSPLPSGQRSRQLQDYDIARILQLMLHFGEYHAYNIRTRNRDSFRVIKHVAEMWNTLSDMCLSSDGRLHIDDLHTKLYFADLKAFIRCLQDLQHVSQQDVDEMNAKLTQIQSSSVEMTSELQSAIESSSHGNHDQLRCILQRPLGTIGKDFEINSSLQPTNDEVVSRDSSLFLRSSNTGTPAINTQTLNVYGNIYSSDRQTIIQGDHFNQTPTIEQGDQFNQTRALPPGHSSISGLPAIQREQLETQGHGDVRTQRQSATQENTQAPPKSDVGDGHSWINDNQGKRAYMEDVREKLSFYYKEAYGKIRFLPSVVKGERNTDDIFVEPDLVHGSTFGNRSNQIKLNSCDELLSLKQSNTVRKRVILVGSAGSGKSTIMHNRLAYDWAWGRKHDDVSLLFVIDMHNIRPHSEVVDIISDQLLHDEPRDKLEQLIKANAKSIVFLLDGLNEASKDWEGKSKGLSSVLHGKWLQGCHVIITTRPNALEVFCTNYQNYTIVDSCGFSNHAMNQFVEKVINKESLVSFQSAIQAYPSWSSWLTTNPLTLSMLCFLWNNFKENLPSCVASLYMKVVRYLIAHTERDVGQNDNDSNENKTGSTSNKDPCLEDVMSVVGELALADLCGQKQRYNTKNLEQNFALKLGICSVYTVIDDCFKPEEFINFSLHRTFQEFFAAHYLVRLNTPGKEKLIREMAGGMENVLRFCCGLDYHTALVILEDVVNASKTDYDKFVQNCASRICFLGSGPDNINPWKISLILLFESDISLVGEQRTNLIHLHRRCEPLVRSIQMKCKNWPLDSEIVPVLEYFLKTVSDHSWLLYVKEATVILESAVELKGVDVKKQTNLLQCLINLQNLTIMSFSPKQHLNCDFVFADRKPEGVGCKKLQRLAISHCDVSLNVLGTFLSHQKESLILALHNIKLKKQTNIPKRYITSVSDLRIIHNADSEHSGIALLEMVTSPIKLSITCSQNMSSEEKNQSEYYYHMQFRITKAAVDNSGPFGIEAGYNPLRFREMHMNNPGVVTPGTGKSTRTIRPRNRDAGQEEFGGYEELPCFGEITQHKHDKRERETDPYNSNWFRLAATHDWQPERVTKLRTTTLPNWTKQFSHLASLPSINRTITNLTCAGCIVGYKSLNKVLCCQNNLVTLSLINVVVAFPDMSRNTEMYNDVFPVSKSITQIHIAHCHFRKSAFVFFLGILPPFASLQLKNVSVDQIEGEINFTGNANSFWVYCQTQSLQNNKGIEQNSVKPQLVRSAEGFIVPHCFTNKERTVLNATGPCWSSYLDESFDISEELKSVIVLNSDCYFTSTDPLVRFLRSIPALTRINLRNINLTGDSEPKHVINDTKQIGVAKVSFRNLLECLAKMPSLSRVFLSCLSIEKELPDFQPVLNCFLNELSISGHDNQECTLRDTVVVQLRKSFSKLSVFTLDNFTLTSSPCSTRLESPEKELLHDAANINLANCRLSTQSFALLLDVLSSNTVINIVNAVLLYLPHDSRTSVTTLTHAKCYIAQSVVCQGKPQSIFIKLDMSLNGLTDDGLKILCHTLQHTLTLHDLDLARNCIGSDGASPYENASNDKWSVLALSFEHTPVLRHLNLASNIIGSCGASALSQSFQFTPKLQHLDLPKNVIGSDGASALAQSLQHIPLLQHFDLADNVIGPDGASALAQSFKHTTILQHLNMAGNVIGADGASALAKSFQHTPGLQRLDLADNVIGHDGASALAQSFKHTTILQHLNMAGNVIGADGASALAKSFQHTPGLQRLDLADNVIGPDGASALAQSFKHTTILQHLNMAGNVIGADGASALAKSFQHTPGLQRLDLADNVIGPDGASALAQSFKHTTILQHLNMAGNVIGADGASALAKSFQHTPVLQRLDLADNVIGPDGASALAQSFQHTPVLRHLNLASNIISSDGASALVQSFRFTPALQHLDLAKNVIGSDGASAVAQSLQHTPALQHLDLAGNMIGADGALALVQSFQHIRALHHLILAGNRIGSDGAPALAQSFQHIPLLQHLDLADNVIGLDGASALAQSFRSIPALQHLDLSKNIIGPDGASALVRSFQHTPALQHLDLGGNGIGPVGASALAQSFKHTTILQHLDLASNKIGRDGASAIAQSFKHTTILQHLNMAGNVIGADGASALAESFQHTPGLQRLDLAENVIGPYGASALAQSFQHTPVLQHLDLAGNIIGADGASALAQSLKHTPSLHHLNLYSNNIRSDGASEIAKSFQYTPALQHLDLSWNYIGSDGTSALAQSFQHISALQHLNLYYNLIGSDEASALAHSFQYLPTLKHLNLYGNSIGSDGASSLAQSFKHTPTLRHLNLCSNKIGPDGASALAQSFHHTPILQHLNLHGNIISSEGASALAQSFQHTQTLQYLNLCGNSIGSDGASALAQSLLHTPAIQHLNLCGNSIGVDGTLALALSFQNTLALQHLDLDSNSIYLDGALALAQSFQYTPALQHHDLHCNNIGSDGAAALALSLQYTPVLQHLNLADNNISSGGASALARSFQKTKLLQYLDLRLNLIELNGKSAIKLSFKNSPSVRYLL